jgi:hypothetical protein
MTDTMDHSPTRPLGGLPGPSRTITIEPVELPSNPPEPLPAHPPERPAADPAEVPVEVPAGTLVAPA